MRRSERKMNLKESEQFLKQAQVGRLGTSHKNEPYVTPLNFLYQKDRIYFHCARNGKKLTNLIGNKRVCFEADEFSGVKNVEEGIAACTSSTYYRSVVAFGDARLITSSDHKKRILEKLVAKYLHLNTQPVFDEEMLGKVTVVEIQVSQLTGKKHLQAPLASSKASPLR
ncbi:MAG TPA: pyridoxamine 5'-phosphate oxidase family protein [Candidatus Bathyarchaeia archaeon]|nr:pyridoxamine 5'-phosphate oxidase family protein [Candidatus Bathyarchaeia archaeon]